MVSIVREDEVDLRIRCRRSTRVRFKRFAASFRNYEEALLYLLDLAEKSKKTELRFL